MQFGFSPELCWDCFMLGAFGDRQTIWTLQRRFWGW
jgi:hypothetical protein